MGSFWCQLGAGFECKSGINLARHLMLDIFCVFQVLLAFRIQASHLEQLQIVNSSSKITPKSNFRHRITLIRKTTESLTNRMNLKLFFH